MKTYIALAIVCCGVPAPASAQQQTLTWTGAIQNLDGATQSGSLQRGDEINSQFSFDLSSATKAIDQSLGGGVYSIYYLPTTDFRFSVGSYSFADASRTATLVYMNDSWDRDGIVIGFDGLPGGPFGSTFTNIQFQARGARDAIGTGGIANGLPLNRFATSFFGGFGGPNTSARVYGDLSIDGPVPEPVTWMMMILGFGAVGYAMRRRPKAVVRFT